MKPVELIDAYLAQGLELFIGGDGRLRVRGPRGLVVAARPALRRYRDVVVAALTDSPTRQETSPETAVRKRNLIDS